MATWAATCCSGPACPYFADPSSGEQANPGSGCPAITGEHHNHAILDWSDQCVATQPSDMAVALAAFDAVVHFETLDGPGELPLSEFYLAVGDSPHRETALPAHALITAVTLPASAVSPRSRYRKVRERASYAFANVSVAAPWTSQTDRSGALGSPSVVSRRGHGALGQRRRSLMALPRPLTASGLPPMRSSRRLSRCATTSTR